MLNIDIDFVKKLYENRYQKIKSLEDAILCCETEILERATYRPSAFVEINIYLHDIDEKYVEDIHRHFFKKGFVVKVSKKYEGNGFSLPSRFITIAWGKENEY